MIKIQRKCMQKNIFLLNSDVSNGLRNDECGKTHKYYDPPGSLMDWNT